MDSLTSMMGSLSTQDTNQRNRKQLYHQATQSYPEYHDLISDELPSMSWNKKISKNGHVHEYDTNIMGTFDCTNTSCSKKRWSSKRVAITIRSYTGDRYNTVVYNQRCKACNRLGDMTIDIDSYTERVVYRLSKWLGLDVVAPDFSGKSTGPHEESLCEGCKAGHCSKIPRY